MYIDGMTERYASTSELIKRSFFEMMKDVATSIPGHILSFNPDTQLAQLQIGVKRVDVNGETFVPPPLIECPVYVYGGDFAAEVQIDPAHEGVILFSQRCIDAWVDTGGVANNPILRFHDFSDAYFLPGIRSQGKVLPDFQNNGIRLRNRDGSQHVWLKNDGSVKIKGASLTIELDDALDITSTTVTHNSVNIGDDHPHTNVEPGLGTSGPPAS